MVQAIDRERIIGKIIGRLFDRCGRRLGCVLFIFFGFPAPNHRHLCRGSHVGSRIFQKGEL